MPLPGGDNFINSDRYHMPFSDLQNAKIGVEASSYLQHMVDQPPAHEPLLAALGGDPLALKHNIAIELDLWKENGMTPVFVFDGQSLPGQEQLTLQNAKASLAETEIAWEKYVANEPAPAVKAFGQSGAVRVQDLFHILQEVLAERQLDFIVAPFNAAAQLAYMDTLDEQYIDGIMGSQELLLYDINDAVISPPSAVDWEKKQFSGHIKSELIKKLAVTPELFIDALLMVGTSFLPPFPPLLDGTIITRQPHTIGDAANLLRTSEKSITATCATFSDVLALVDPKWLDKFRKARMGIKHCVTVQVDGFVAVRDYDNLTSDNKEYLSLQLPPELYHYLSKAMIGPRLLNAFSSVESVVLPTLDGVASDEYKTLVTEALPPLMETATSLISSRIHRAFQYQVLKLKYWFDPTKEQDLNPRNLQSQTNQQAVSWSVKDASLKARESALGIPAGNLSFALFALEDEKFASESIAEEKVTDLTSTAEITSNVLWRLLHLRGYINDKHELTSWGKALATTLKSISPAIKQHKDVHHAEEAAFLAYELIRFNQLNSRNPHPELIGGAMRGSEDDKANCILIARTASLLKLRHNHIGYTGPLSKNLLLFHSIIKAVRETDRDLLEAVTASLFLHGQANRTRDDYGVIGRSLPFTTDVDIGLGIAVKTYLDDHLKLPATPEEREAAKSNYVQKLLPQSVNFPEDLDVAFRFFDALHEGVKTLGSEISRADKNSWDNAKAYLEKRR